MGNKISTVTPSTASAGIDSYVSELGDIQYERRQVIANTTGIHLRQTGTDNVSIFDLVLEVHDLWKLSVAAIRIV